MDKIGFMIGLSKLVKVIYWKPSKHTRKTQARKRDLVTVLESVSAAGSPLPPMVIHKGKSHLKDSPVFTKRDGTHFARLDKGWTSREIGLDYLTMIFKPNTKAT